MWCAAFVSGCGADIFGNASARFAHALGPHALTPSRSRASGFTAKTAVGGARRIGCVSSGARRSWCAFLCILPHPSETFCIFCTALFGNFYTAPFTLCPSAFFCAFYTLSASRRRESRASKFGGSGQVKCMASPVRGWVKDNSPACRHWPSSRAACFFSKGVGAPP